MLLACTALLSAQQADRPLSVKPRQDAMSIAEQLYVQASSQGSDPNQKQQTLLSAAKLFEDYSKRFPKAPDKDKALYRQASCLDEAGDPAAANVILGTLANSMHGEYSAAAAYRLGTQSADRCHIPSWTSFAAAKQTSRS